MSFRCQILNWHAKFLILGNDGNKDLKRSFLEVLSPLEIDTAECLLFISLPGQVSYFLMKFKVAIFVRWWPDTWSAPIYHWLEYFKHYCSCMHKWFTFFWFLSLFLIFHNLPSLCREFFCGPIYSIYTRTSHQFPANGGRSKLLIFPLSSNLYFKDNFGF